MQHWIFFHLKPWCQHSAGWPDFNVKSRLDAFGAEGETSTSIRINTAAPCQRQHVMDRRDRSWGASSLSSCWLADIWEAMETPVFISLPEMFPFPLCFDKPRRRRRRHPARWWSLSEQSEYSYAKLRHSGFEAITPYNRQPGLLTR